MQRKLSDYRGHSPIRSPIKSPIRAISPIRYSPFSRQAAPMSPLRARKFQRSTTPTKIKGNNRVQLVKQPLYNTQNYQTNAMMQRTLKNGVGLFQQLVNQHKIGSEKKQTKPISQNTNPFEYSQKKKETLSNFHKNSFAALIQNVKQIQSIQASKANNNYFNSQQLSFRTVQRSKPNENSSKPQIHLMRKNTQPVPISVLESFGSPNPSELSENILQPKNSIKKFQINNQIEAPFSEQSLNNQPQVPLKANPQIASSFEDVILLIKKASQRVKQQSDVIDEEVRVSFEEDKSRLSFNMNPFI